MKTDNLSIEVCEMFGGSSADMTNERAVRIDARLAESMNALVRRPSPQYDPNNPVAIKMRRAQAEIEKGWPALEHKMRELMNIPG